MGSPKNSSADVVRTTGNGTSPRVAAAFIAGLVYIWLEALLRLLLTYSILPPGFELWNGRVGDIAAMWLTMSVVGLIVYFILAYGAFRHKTRIGSITFWTVVLIISAVLAPLIGEIGTPWGI